MKTLTWSCGLTLCLAIAAGCAKKEAPETQAAPVAPPTPPPATADTGTLAATSVDLDSVPVEEQFEKEAEESVTAANLEQQLAALEKELQAE